MTIRVGLHSHSNKQKNTAVNQCSTLIRSLLGLSPVSSYIWFDNRTTTVLALTTAVLLQSLCRAPALSLPYSCRHYAVLLHYHCRAPALPLPCSCLTTAVLLPYHCRSSPCTYEYLFRIPWWYPCYDQCMVMRRGRHSGGLITRVLQHRSTPLNITYNTPCNTTQHHI